MELFKVNRKQAIAGDVGRVGLMNNGYSIRTLLIILVLFFMACDSSNANGPQGQARVKQLIENGALVGDVRTQQEYDSGHFPNALHIPVAAIPQRLDEFGTDKDRPIVLYCLSGARSGQAKAFLEAKGYRNVVNAGGINDMPDVAL